MILLLVGIRRRARRCERFVSGEGGQQPLRIAHRIAIEVVVEIPVHVVAILQHLIDSVGPPPESPRAVRAVVGPNERIWAMKANVCPVRRERKRMVLDQIVDTQRRPVTLQNDEDIVV